MSAPTVTLADQIMRLWGPQRGLDAPVPADAPPEPTPGEITRALTAEIGDAPLRDQFAQLLAGVVDAVQSGRAMSPPEWLLVDRVLTLAGSVQGPEVPDALARRTVLGVPPALAYFRIAPIIDRYLGRAELLETLLDGLRRAATPDALEDALTGVRMYQYAGQPDATPEAAAPLLAALEREIAPHQDSADAEVARLADGARAALPAYASR